MYKKYHWIIFLATVFLAVSCSKPLMQPEVQTTENEKTVQEPFTVSAVGLPLDRALERITKKPFGIFVEPGNSPVDPEKFRGYHNATDFEIFDNEIDTDISVRAICDGKLLQKRTATGYGGLVVQSCTIDEQAVTVVYGHLRLSSINSQVGAEIKRGDTLGLLGKAYSTETSGERKHLHLGIHKGTAIDIRGYVPNKSELSAWLNFEELVK